MPRRGKRKRLATGIFEDKAGRSGIVYIHGRPKEYRFDPGTAISKIRQKLNDELKRLQGSGRARSYRGTLAAAVDAWDGQEAHLASWRERRAELRAWVKLYGDKRLNAIDAEDARRAMGSGRPPASRRRRSGIGYGA